LKMTGFGEIMMQKSEFHCCAMIYHCCHVGLQRECLPAKM
jgi:hypothetical protein